MTKRFTREAREAAVARMKEGADATALATELGCHPATLSGWLRKSQIDPLNAPQPGGGAAGAEKILGAQSAQSSVKPMDPQVLVGAFSGLRSMIVEAVANGKGLDTTHPSFEKLSTMPKGHEDTLATLAPEAAKVAPEYLQYAPQAALIGMVVVCGVSTWAACRQVSRIVAALEAKAERDARASKERPANGTPTIVVP